MAKYKSEEKLFKQNEDDKNLFFKKRSELMNKVLHTYNTGNGGTYDELMAITKALRYKKENLSEEESFRRFLKELQFIRETNKRGLSKQFEELYVELIKTYGKPESLDSELIKKQTQKNQNIKWSNIIIGLLFAIVLILIFLFLR